MITYLCYMYMQCFLTVTRYDKRQKKVIDVIISLSTKRNKKKKNIIIKFLKLKKDYHAVSVIRLLSQEWNILQCNRFTLWKHLGLNINISFKTYQVQTYYVKTTWGFLSFMWKPMNKYNNLFGVYIFNDVSAYVYIYIQWTNRVDECIYFSSYLEFFC